MLPSRHLPDPGTCEPFDPDKELVLAGDYYICECPAGHFGVHFRCPCGCGFRYFLPIVEGPPQGGQTDPWGWTGGRAAATLRPSILNKRCGWHGYLVNGNWRLEPP